MTKPLRYAENYAQPARKTRECSWPIGDPGERGFRFCGASAAFGKVYCAEHAERAVAQPQPRSRPLKSLAPSQRR